MGGRCSEMGGGKPLFLAIYATVVAGIIFTALFIFSSLYGGGAVNSSVFSLAPSTPTLPSHEEKVIESPKVSESKGDVSAIPPPSTITPVPLLQPKSTWTREIWDVPPAGSAMPPLKIFKLTKEMVEYRVKNNVIIVTFGNYAFKDFILTWVKHLTDINVSNLLVGAMDTKLLEALYWKGIPVFDMGSNINPVDVGWGSPTFHKMGREKVLLINAFLPFGYELLMCDTDMVWLKDPLPYIARFPDADILTSSDEVVPTVTDDRLDVWTEVLSLIVVHASYNIGIFHWRPTKSSMKFAKEWIEMLVADDKIWDQNGFNDLMRKSLGPSVDGDNGLFYAYDGSLKVGILPVSIFCSGHTYFVQEMPQQLNLEPYAVHTTFQYGGTEGKRHRLREAMLFFDPPEYFDSLGGFLSFKPRIPRSLLLEGAHTVESHFSLVNYQIKQVRTALAIASLLNRTLVMPPLWCRFDRMWYPHPGILPRSMTRQPFVCPMDHVFEVNSMLREMPEAEFGPRIDFREYSFLENPLLPKQIKESRLEVQLCQEQSASCNETRPGLIRFPKNSNEEMFTKVFSSHKDVKVIEFSSMDGAFQGFADKEREEKFRRRVKKYTGIWCCVENKKIGHIYYDIYWDEKPEWKPAPPEKPEDDHPPL